MSGTAAQYLSAAKEMAMRKYPQNILWEEKLLERWHPSLRVAVEKKFNRIADFPTHYLSKIPPNFYNVTLLFRRFSQ